MNISPIVLAVDNLTSGTITDADISALAGVFREYLDDDAAPITALSDGCPKGLRHAVRELRWRRHIAQATALLDSPSVSNHSIAAMLSREFNRVSRMRRPPHEHDRIGVILSQALQSHPTGGTSISALWPIVAESRIDTYSSR